MYMFKRFVFNRLNTIHDLKTLGYIPKKINREAINVCIIDDEGFSEKRLSLTGYKKVTVKTEYSEINDFEHYDIIACDINGVGKDINAKKQGISVAQTIKANYPTKTVLIYSSNDPREYDDDYKNAVDGFFKKSGSMDEIAGEFDKYATEMFDANKAWSKIERLLRDDKTPNKTIAFIEDKYVRSVSEKTNLFSSRKDDTLMYLGIAKTMIELIISIVALVI